jgi:hypothetical protein
MITPPLDLDATGDKIMPVGEKSIPGRIQAVQGSDLIFLLFSAGL